MNLYWIENKIYMEIPKAVLGKRLLMGGVVDKVSNPQESSVGFRPATSLQVRFCQSDSLVRLYRVANRPTTGDGSRIGDALKIALVILFWSSFQSRLILLIVLW